jgi:hypothetical protein
MPTAHRLFLQGYEYAGTQIFQCFQMCNSIRSERLSIQQLIRGQDELVQLDRLFDIPPIVSCGLSTPRARRFRGYKRVPRLQMRNYKAENSFKIIYSEIATHITMNVY